MKTMRNLHSMQTIVFAFFLTLMFSYMITMSSSAFAQEIEIDPAVKWKTYISNGEEFNIDHVAHVYNTKNHGVELVFHNGTLFTTDDGKIYFAGLDFGDEGYNVPKSSNIIFSVQEFPADEIEAALNLYRDEGKLSDAERKILFTKFPGFRLAFTGPQTFKSYWDSPKSARYLAKPLYELVWGEGAGEASAPGGTFEKDSPAKQNESLAKQFGNSHICLGEGAQKKYRVPSRRDKKIGDLLVDEPGSKVFELGNLTYKRQLKWVKTIYGPREEYVKEKVYDFCFKDGSNLTRLKALFIFDVEDDERLNLSVDETGRFVNQRFGKLFGDYIRIAFERCGNPESLEAYVSIVWSKMSVRNEGSESSPNLKVESRDPIGPSTISCELPIGKIGSYITRTEKGYKPGPPRLSYPSIKGGAGISKNDVKKLVQADQ